MHTRIAGGCLYHASVALGKPINTTKPRNVIILGFVINIQLFTEKIKTVNLQVSIKISAI